MVNIAKTIPTFIVDLFIAPIMRSFTKITGTTITNINQEKDSIMEIRVVIKGGNRVSIISSNNH